MIVASSYAAIGSELDALQSTSWIATAYMLTTTSFQPLYGKLSDIFGRKACLLFAYFTFALGCLLCGLSRNITELIAARAFSGIGGGGITTVGSIIMSDVAPLRQRGTWQGFANIVFAAGQAVGAPLGGLLADTIGWRWSFLLQVPLALLAITSVTLTLKLPKTETSNFISNLKRVDFLGAITLVTAIFLLLVGLDRGGNLSWQHPITVASLSGFAILFPAFILIEWKFAKEPFAPKHIVMEPTLLAAYLCNFLGIGAQMAFIYHASLYFQAVEGRTAARAGLFLIPNVVTSVTGSLGGGLIMQITGRYRTLTITAFVFGVLGTTVATLYAGILGTSDVLIVIGSASAGLGIGTAITTTLIALIANAGPQNQAVATAVSYLFRSLGSVVGLSLVSTAAQETLRSKLYSRLSGNDAVEEIIEGARKSLNYIAELPPKIREKVVLSYADSVRLAFWLSVSLYLAALISSWYIKEKVLLPK
ncbi:member of the major facilitator superfamily [Panus rudis PR-1116 ss-1]|nr:member of the major facilitator superfamily [Panus rudis PR-1116 ss-1]